MTSQEDKIISDFLNAIGPWREYVVIGGGFALFIYKLYLAEPGLENPPIGTRDVDSLLPRRVPEISKKDLSKHLQEAGFKLVFRGVDIPATEFYEKEIDGVEVEIEFLTDTAARKDKNKNVVIAGVVAQPLSYLSMSLEMTMEFQTQTSIIGRVVSPGAWMFHKGLTFPRRARNAKMVKDLYGIWYVASQLGDFSEQAILEFNILSQQYPKWFKTLQKNLHSWMLNASPDDWSNLEQQDPSGRLKMLNFERIAKSLIL